VSRRVKRGLDVWVVVIIEFIKVDVKCYTLGVHDAIAVNIIPPDSKKNDDRQKTNEKGR
jgi:hypothetical protein